MAAAINDAHRGRVQVNHDQLIAVIAQGHQVFVRRSCQAQGATNLHPFQPRHGHISLVGLVDFQGVFAAGVADHHHALSIGQPGG